MCLNSESYFDLLASFIRHLLILVIKKACQNLGLDWATFKKFIIFSLIEW